MRPISILLFNLVESYYFLILKDLFFKIYYKVAFIIFFSKYTSIKLYYSLRYYLLNISLDRIAIETFRDIVFIKLYYNAGISDTYSAF